MLPHNLLGDVDEDREPSTPGPNDNANLDLSGGASLWADPLNPLANLASSLRKLNFLKELKDLSSMSGPDIAGLVSELPGPQVGNVEGCPWRTP